MMRYSGFINGAVLMFPAVQRPLAADGMGPAFAKDEWVYLDTGSAWVESVMSALSSGKTRPLWRKWRWTCPGRGLKRDAGTGAKEPI